MKLVKNSCFGGFSLSPKAIARFAELKGKKAYFFKGLGEKITPVSLSELDNDLFFSWYTVPDPEKYKLNEPDEDGLYKGANERYKKISLEINDRTDPDLIKVVEELGKEADGRCASLEIVEIPDGIEWEI